jgi:hypothetical protein
MIALLVDGTTRSSLALLAEQTYQQFQETVFDWSGQFRPDRRWWGVMKQVPGWGESATA